MKKADAPAMLMVSMEPPASLEEEFNDWYDTEHFPQRCALPGVEAASRWTCIDGWPRWMALYDLSSAEALQSEAYRAVSGANSTPWSKRVLPRTVGRSRVVGVALDALQAVRQHDSLRTCRLLVFSVSVGQEEQVDRGASAANEFASEIAERLSTRDDLLQRRFFIDDSAMLWTLAAFDTPVRSETLAALIGRPRGKGLATFNLYLPYRRSTY
jgi:hypothetical protein